MTNELEHKPLVGDDGELLEADTSFPRIAYVEPSITPQTLPASMRLAIGGLVIFGVIVVGILFIGLVYIKPLTAPNTVQYPIPAQPTEFADHAVYLQAQFRLPDAQSATEWDTGLANVHGLNWSPNGSWLAINYGQNQVANLDIASGEYTFKDLPATAFDWSPIDANQFVAADSQQIGIHSNVSLQTMLKPSAQFTMPPSLVRWSTDGSQIAALSQDRKLINIMYASDGGLATERLFEAPVWDMNWSPTMASLLAVKDSGLIFIQPNNKLIRQKQAQDIRYPDSSINWKLASYAPDGLRMALVGWDCGLDLALFDRVGSSIRLIRRMEDYSTQNCTNNESEIVWSPKGEQIATFIHGEDAVYLWNGKNATISDRLIPLRSRAITALAWSPDGKYLVISSAKNITIWSPNKV